VGRSAATGVGLSWRSMRESGLSCSEREREEDVEVVVEEEQRRVDDRPGPDLQVVAASPRRGEEEEGGGRGGCRRRPPCEPPHHRHPWSRGPQPVVRASSAGRGGGTAAGSNFDMCL
jgi:hypothetical protein